MVNFGNGNARSEEGTADVLRSFGAAVTLSASIVLGARVLFAKRFQNLKGSKLILANTLLNMVAVGTANATNVMLMRQNELVNGISVTNKKGTIEYGKSVEAGRRAVFETCLSRFCMPAAGLLLPVATYSYLKRMRLLPKNMAGLAAVRLLLVYGSFSLMALPMSTGIFEPQQSIDIGEIDSEFGERSELMNEVEKVYFYKGT